MCFFEPPVQIRGASFYPLPIGLVPGLGGVPDGLLHASAGGVTPARRSNRRRCPTRPRSWSGSHRRRRRGGTCRGSRSGNRPGRGGYRAGPSPGSGCGPRRRSSPPMDKKGEPAWVPRCACRSCLLILGLDLAPGGILNGDLGVEDPDPVLFHVIPPAIR